MAYISGPVRDSARCRSVPRATQRRVPLFSRNVNSDSIVAPLTLNAPVESRIGFASSESRMAWIFAASSAVVGVGLPDANAHWSGVAAHQSRKRYIADSVAMYCP
jgi:hypothetical protein